MYQLYLYDGTRHYEPCNIINELTEQERRIIEIITRALQRIKPIITFPKDMSSLIINNKREIIKEIGTSLWNAIISSSKIAEQLDNNLPT